MYTRNRVKTEVVLAEFAVPWELRPKRSSEGEREREIARISPRVMEYVRQRSICFSTFPRVFKFRVMLFADFEEVAILLHFSREAVGETSRARNE